MKKKKLTWSPIYTNACFVVLAATVLFTVLRAVLTPVATEAPLAYGLALGITVLFALAVVAYASLGHHEPTTVGGKTAVVSAAAAAVTGTAFLVFTVISALNWWIYQAFPYPNKAVVGKLDVLLLFIQLVAGALSAAWLVLVAVRWWRTGKTSRMCCLGLAVMPVVWCWIRLIRYVTSYLSLVGFFRNAYELGTMIAELLFFLLLLRQMTGATKPAGRFFIGVCLCAGMFCTISALSQVWFFITQDGWSFNTTLLVTAVDFGVAFLAFSTAFAQGMGTPVAEQIPEVIVESVPENDEESEDGDGAEFLLSDEMFAVYDPEEAEED